MDSPHTVLGYLSESGSDKDNEEEKKEAKDSSRSAIIITQEPVSLSQMTNSSN